MANGADGSIVIDTQLDDTGFKRGTQQLENAINSLVKTLNGIGGNMSGNVQQVITNLRTAGQQTQAIQQSLSQAPASNDFEKSLNGVQRQAATLQTQLQRMGDSTAQGFKNDGQIIRFQTQVQHAQERLQGLQDTMNNLGGQSIDTAEFSKLTTEIDKAEKALFKLYDRRDIMQELGTDESSVSWQRLAIQIRNAEQELERMERSRDAMTANGTASFIGADAEQFQRVQATLAGMAASLAQYQEMAAAAEGALSGFGAALRSAGSTALSTAGNLARMPFTAVASGVKALGERLRSIRRESNGATELAQKLTHSLTSLKRMLVTRVKRMFTSEIFKNLQNSIQSLAKYSSAFNASMSSMKNAAKGLSGNLAVSFGNLVNALAPAITTIINLISQAIIYLNAFFALISGKSTMTVAKKSTDSYASSLKSAGGAAKELKNQVYGFDELNKENDTSSSGGGGSGSGISYEEQDISSLLPESVMEMFNAIKEAIAGEHWEEVGSIIASGLNTIVSTIDNCVVELREKATQWSKNIARILNGFVTGFDWENLGKLIGDGLNLAFDTVNTFLTTFNFKEFGTGLGKGINGAVKNTEWSMIAATFANKWNAILNTIRGSVTTVDWRTMGTSIAKGCNSWFSTIDWGGIVTGFGEAVTAAASLLKSFVEGISWSEIGTTIGDAINNVDLEKWTADFGATLYTFGMGIYDLFTDFVETVDWKSLGVQLWNSIYNFVSSFDWAGVVSSMFEFLGAEVGAAVALVAGFGEQLWNQIRAGWEATKAYFTEYFDAYGGDIIAGLWAGIINALKSVGQWIVDNIFTPFINGFKATFGIASPSTVMEEQGGYIIAGLWEGLQKKWNEIVGAVTEFFNGIWETIEGFFGDLGETARKIWDGFTEGLSAKWSEISGAVGEVLSGAWDAITDAFGSLSEIAGSIWEGFSSTLSTAWSSVSSAVLKVFTDAWDSITSVFSDVATVATNLWNGLKDGLSTGWTELKESILQPFKDMWQAVKDFFGIASPSTEAASIGDFILQGLVNGFSSAVEGVITTVTAIFGRIWDAIKSIFGFGGGESDESKEAKQAGKDIMTGMKDGITGDEETVKTEIKNVAKEALKALRTELGVPESGSGASTKTKPYGESIVEGLTEGISTKGVAETFTNVANNAWSAVQSALNTAFGTEEGGSASKANYVGETTVQGINDGIDSKAENSTFSTAATATLDAIKGALNSAFGMASDTSSATKTKPAGEGIVKGISDGIKEKGVKSTFSSVATTVGNEIAGAFNSALGISGGNWFSSASASKFNDVGKAICQGVADGINTNVSTIKTAAESAAKAALQAAKNKLGIHSPSKAFAEIGDYMMQGMSNGLKDGQGEVAHTVSNIAASLTDGMGGTTFDVGADAMVSGMDRVADKFIQFVQQLNAVTDALAGGVLQQPAIATGAYIPPRTRIDGTSLADDQLISAMAQQSRDQDEMFSLIREKFDDMIELTQRLLQKDTTIDGQSLERTLSGLQRDRIRAFGGAY